MKDKWILIAMTVALAANLFITWFFIFDSWQINRRHERVLMAHEQALRDHAQVIRGLLPAPQQGGKK